MTLPSSGPLSFSQIKSELGLAGTRDINESDIRGLGNVFADRSTIIFSNFRGRSKANIPPPPSTTITSEGAPFGSASVLIQRIGSPGTYSIRVTVTCSGEVAVWNFTGDFGASSFADNQQPQLGGGNAAYVALQKFASHSPWGYGFVEYDGTNVTILCDYSCYSFNLPPNPTFGTFLAANGLSEGCPPGSGAFNDIVNAGRSGLAGILNPTQAAGGFVIQHGFPGILSRAFPATRNP